MPSKRTPAKQKGRATRIEYPMLDQLEAMVRHPEFRRILPLQQSIRDKKYSNLTEEEALENNAPRTRIRIAATMEADRQWLSASIQKIRQGGEAAWAYEAVNSPNGDETDTIDLSTRIPANLSPDAILLVLGKQLRQQRKQCRIVPTQHPRRHELDKWKVYDLHEKGRTLMAITRRLFKVTEKTNYNSKAAACYGQVRRAYNSACAMIQALNQKP